MPVEDIGVGNQLRLPNAVVSFQQFLVFLSNISHNRADNGGEIFVTNLIRLLAHLTEMNIEALANMLAILTRRLDKEPGGLDVASVLRAREDNIAKLFLGAQLVKRRLL